MSTHDLDIQVERVEKMACHGCGFAMEVADAEPFSIVRCRACRVLLRVPARLGDFLLIQRLGQGATGATFLARDTKLDRQVAIKVIREALDEQGELAASVMREARALAALNHRHVVDIYSVNEFAGQPFIVMELIDGPTLATVITEHGPMDQAKAVRMTVQVADALRAANEIGLVHGDVKPANILFAPDGQVKIVDFGLVRTADAAPDDKMRGTPYYIAPEQAEGQPSDHRADIFSLGATLFHALTGRRPFEGRSLQEVIRARLERDAPEPRTLRPDLSSDLAAVVTKMLARDPQQRYADYDELTADLNRVEQFIELAEGATASEPPAPQAEASPRRRSSSAERSREPSPSPAPQPAAAAGATVPAEALAEDPWDAMAVRARARTKAIRRGRHRSGRGAIVAVGIFLAVLIVAGVALVIWGLSATGVFG